jgi:hypothetical protein
VATPFEIRYTYAMRWIAIILLTLIAYKVWETDLRFIHLQNDVRNAIHQIF